MSTLDYTREVSVIEGKQSLRELDELIAKPLDTKPDRKYYIALSITLSLASLLVIGLGLTFYYGIGMWGNNIPVGWAFDITNFVFWVGIGHAGTLISAILFLFRQKWRTGIARAAEAMTIFAVMTAGLFPLIHVGRPWLAGYLFPYPSQHSVWVNFTSPLLWDVFAVSTYLTVSLIFWYVGLIPDLATLREKTTGKIKKVFYSTFSLGWRFSNRHWQHYEMVYLVLAGFATPLVLSVHTIVSFDFAVSILPGWHSTIFPPYFVAGAVFSGFAMVQNVLIIVRKIFNYEHIITLDTLDKMNKIMLLTGSMVGYAYAMEFFIAWYGGVEAERFTFLNRALGPYAWAYWTMITCNVITPQLFWFKKIRRTIPVMFVIAIFVNVGMWFERFVIIVTSLSRDFLPSSWHHYTPTYVDGMILAGSFGFFLTCVLLFIKTLPVISMVEVKSVSNGAQPSHKEHQ
ncbi:MAG: polysulfide reductase NrfD [Ignavibacteriales bacterium]|nr:polysulfide reductase NrfD [Ignavibacteriales bacterium]